MIVVTVFRAARRGLCPDNDVSMFFDARGAADFQATLTGTPEDGLTWDECWVDGEPDADPFDAVSGHASACWGQNCSGWPACRSHMFGPGEEGW